MKPLLTSDELIQDMENRGIAFTIDDKECAKNFLEKHNYYMKLASYRANYKDYRAGSKNDGKYIGLEFAYLRELSTIDMHLRYAVIRMALDIEHYLKVRLLNAIENNQKENGYGLIQDFLNLDPNKSLLQAIYENRKKSSYCKDLIEKHYPDFPAWVFVEVIPFGKFTFLCDFYHKRYEEQLADRILLNSVRDIRNAAAHSNCLINRLTPGNNRAHHIVVKRVKQIPSISENSRDKKLSNKFLYDFTCLLFAYDEIVSSRTTKTMLYKELQELFTGRMLKNKDWFAQNPTITSAYDFAKKILDNFE